MPQRRLALIVVSAALCIGPRVHAQGDIEMDDDPVKTDAPADTAQPTDQPSADQPVVKDPKVAKKWLQAGDMLVRKGDQLTKQSKADEAKTQYANAVTAYQKAIEASPADDVSLNFQLAIAEDKAGNTVDALKHLKLVATATNLKPDVVKKAQGKLDEFSMKVGTVTLTVKPDGTQIMIDGKQVGEAPMTEPLVLMPGTIKVSFAAVGYQPKDVELKIEAGSESERKIELEAVPIKVKPVINDEPDTSAAAGPKKAKMLPIYIGGGATVGLAILATVTGIIAVGDHATYIDPKATMAERADAQSSGRTMAHVTDLCLVGAIGAAAFTTYWYLYKFKPEERALAAEQNQAKVDVVPWVQPEGGGLAAVGSF